MIDIGADLQRAFDEGYEKGKADRPTGKWIEHEHGFWTFVNDKGERDGWIPDYECNLCGARAWRVKTPFCPTCGARMEGADDE